MNQGPTLGNEYDALADLFLGDGVLAAVRPGARPSARASDTAMIEPKPQHSVAPTQTGAPPAGQQATPEIRTRAIGQVTPRQVRARIEALVMGHLPVLASAWATQYARTRAEETGMAVAIVRLRGGHVAVETIGMEDAPEADDLESAIAGASRVGAWILHTDESLEPSACTLEGVDAVTLLSGADQAAIAGGCARLQALGEHGLSAPVRVVIAGADAEDERAQGAARRLLKWSEEHLDRAVQIAGFIRKIGAAPGGATANGSGPAAPSTVYRAESDATPASVVAMIIASRGAKTVAGSADGPTVTPAPAAHASEPAMPAASTPAATQPAPRQASASQPTADAGPVMPGGLRMLAFACPFAKAVRLAVDESGRLHAVAGPGMSTAECVEQLLIAADWAAAHADLVRLASPAVKDAGALMHLVTTEPGTARGLVGGRVRVHAWAGRLVEL